MAEPDRARWSPDLITGGPEHLQCPHGVPRGRWLRPDSNTPACALCRREYLRQTTALLADPRDPSRDAAAAAYGHALLQRWKADRSEGSG